MKKIILSIDIQNEYITCGRPFCIKSINRSLQNAAIVIAQFRKSDIPIYKITPYTDSNIGRNAKQRTQE